MSKQEATRLADALRRCAPVDFDGDFAAAAALLDRWPDAGEPVAYQYLFDGYNGPVWRSDSGPWNGMQPKASRPLYTAPPAESERIAALETELQQYKAAAPLCEQHRPTGGTRSTCLICACQSLSAALSRISYACEPPNEYECSAYDVHCSETAVVSQVQERIAALEAENAKLLDAVADKVSAATMLTGMTTGPDGLRLALQGGAASLLAEMLAQQFKDGGGINYLELSFVSRKAAPGDAFVVTVQRVLGKTPHALRAEAEAKHAALEAALEQARVALEHIDLDARVARPYVGQVSRLGGIASAALRKIEEVQR